MSAALWQQPAPVEEKKIPEGDLVSQTEQILIDQGYCYWRCELFGGDVIKIVLDDKACGSIKYPVWTLEELLMANDLPASTLKLVQRAKILRTGARIVSVEDVLESDGSEWEIVKEYPGNMRLSLFD
jgi:hypothetical protein